GTAISTGTGAIQIAGAASSVDPSIAPVAKGVWMAAGSQVTSTSGAIDITGSTSLAGSGVQIDPEWTEDGVRPPADISTGGQVMLRASNNGATDALELGGTVTAGTVLNLRPGIVNSAGVAADLPNGVITL